MLTRSLAVVASENIEDGEVIGQYLGELEHVSAVRVNRPRNNGYRLVMTQRPEVPAHPVRIAINAEHMGGVMRFVNHSCRPAARFAVVANGRRTTVVVVTTRGIRHGEKSASTMVMISGLCVDAAWTRAATVEFRTRRTRDVWTQMNTTSIILCRCSRCVVMILHVMHR